VAGSRSDDLQRRYSEYYRKRFGDLDVVRAPAVQDDRDANVLKIAESYVLKAPFDAEDGERRGLDIFGESLDGATQLPQQMARTSPVQVGRVADYRHEIQVRSPRGWRSVAAEEESSFSSPAFAYRRSVEREGDDVRVLYEMKVKAREVDATQASAHLAEMRRARENLSARLRFQAPMAPLEASERDARLKALLRDAMGSEGTQ